MSSSSTPPRKSWSRASPDGASARAARRATTSSPSPPRKQGLCDRCGGVLIQRSDDSEEIIRNRLREFAAKTKPVIDYFDGARLAGPHDRRQRQHGSDLRANLRGCAALLTGWCRLSIKLKSPAEIAKLREANLVVADVLDQLEAAAKPGAHDLGPQRDRRPAAQAAQGRVGLPRLSRLPGRAVHLGQRRRRPRHPAQGRRAQGRGPALDRLRGVQAGLVRRLGPDHPDRDGQPRGARPS